MLNIYDMYESECLTNGWNLLSILMNQSMKVKEKGKVRNKKTGSILPNETWKNYEFMRMNNVQNLKVGVHWDLFASPS